MDLDERKVVENSVERILSAFGEFVNTVAMLRHPTEGCPWDLKQDHQTLRRFMIEEAYEASDAMASGNAKLIAEELGDVLLQVVLNAQIGAERGEFSIEDVINQINKKMVFRHPHVFSSGDPLGIGGMESEKRDIHEKDRRQQWDNLKAIEKKKEKAGIRSVAFEEAYGMFPATIQAWKIGRLAEGIDFDWKDYSGVLDQLKSEVAELEQELNIFAKGSDDGPIRQELGDVFFTLAQLCRHLGCDPEVVASDGNLKFLNLFKLVEEIAAGRGVDLKEATSEQKEAFWQEAKNRTRSN